MAGCGLERARAGSDHATAAPRAAELAGEARVSHPPAPGWLRPSQVPGPEEPASVARAVPRGAGRVRLVRPGGASAGVTPVLARPSAVPARPVRDVLRSAGQPLPGPLRAEMESRLGADFSDVRLHTGAAAAASAAEVGARSYTSGSHVVLGEGGADKHTLAHELTHVLQQRHGPVAGTDHGGGLKVSDPSDAYERAADANAARVMSGPARHWPAGPAAAGAGMAAGLPGGQFLPVQRIVLEITTEEGETREVVVNDYHFARLLRHFNKPPGTTRTHQLVVTDFGSEADFAGLAAEAAAHVNKDFDYDGIKWGWGKGGKEIFPRPGRLCVDLTNAQLEELMILAKDETYLLTGEFAAVAENEAWFSTLSETLGRYRPKEKKKSAKPKKTVTQPDITVEFIARQAGLTARQREKMEEAMEEAEYTALQVWELYRDNLEELKTEFIGEED